MPDCVHCGGSGVLNIVWSGPLSTDPREPVSDYPYATSCHCEMGQVMAEVGVDA